jgi:ribitol-5-phosphate 2-dehydrogenase (NADP+) / D-ribitol-5-phosphate cytidylyltransferase
VKTVRTVAVILTSSAADPSDSEDIALAQLAGRLVIEYSVAAYESAEPVNEILVVAAPAPAVQVRRALAGRGYRKMAGVLEGGPSRVHSVLQAMAAIGEPECDVLIHEAAYPLVSTPVIEECAAALRIHEAVCAAVPASDTMVKVENNLITVRPERNHLRRRQSPQGFRLSVLRRAYQLALAGSSLQPADDCALVLRYLPDVPVALIPGSERNLEITNPDDIKIAETMLGSALN